MLSGLRLSLFENFPENKSKIRVHRHVFIIISLNGEYAAALGRSCKSPFDQPRLEDYNISRVD